MTDVVRIVGGCYVWCGWTLCVYIRGSVQSSQISYRCVGQLRKVTI
jgi:hypothetical protein